MDAKQKEILTNEVWDLVVNQNQWCFKSDVYNYSGGILSANNELVKNWLISPISKIIGKNPDFKSDMSFTEEAFENQLKSMISELGYSDCEFDYKNDGFCYRSTIIKYHNQEISINYDPNEKKCKYKICINSIVPELIIKEYPRASTEYTNKFPIAAFNLMALFDFLDNGIDDFVEVFKYRYEYLKLFWENFVKLPFDTQISAYREGYINSRKLADSFLTYLDTEQIPIIRKALAMEFNSPELPTYKEVGYDAEKEFISPFREHYARYINDQDAIDINVDPECPSAFNVTINGKNAYIKFSEDYDYVYIEPTKTRFVQRIDTFACSWNELIRDVVVGLNNVERYAKFYDAVSKIEQQFSLNYYDTIDSRFSFPRNEEDLPTCWKK